mgnify:CR=1 FL=1
MSRTAILVDGGFFRRRVRSLCGEHSPEETADALISYCRRHLREHGKTHDLYRIFYYDCPPAGNQVFHPLTGHSVNLKNHETYKWMTAFLNCMKKKRKVALRLGILDTDNTVYTLNYSAVKKLCNGSLTVSELTEKDFVLTVSQKGVDMKIGVDISTLSYNHLVDQIVIIGNDRDYIPAIKLARTAGVDVVLDILGENLSDSNPLVEHIDGLRSCGNLF